MTPPYDWLRLMLWRKPIPTPTSVIAIITIMVIIVIGVIVFLVNVPF